MRLSIVGNLLSFLVLTAIAGIVPLALNAAGVGHSNSLRVWAVSSVVAAVAFFLVRKRLWDYLIIEISEVVLKRWGAAIGLRKIFPNFDEAAKVMVERFDQAEDVRIFIQLGGGMLGGRNSVLFDRAKRRRERTLNLRILYADSASQHLSQDKAEKRKTSYWEWMSAVKFTEGSIAALMDSKIEVSARRHGEPYLWRLVFLDKALFFAPYLYEHDNSKQAPVFEFCSEATSTASLYSVFEKYFEAIWSASENRQLTSSTTPG